MGKGVVDKLKEIYDIEDLWVSYELHPETPPEGILLGEKINLTGVPTFIINEKFKIVGAQPLQVFQETFGRIGD